MATNYPTKREERMAQKRVVRMEKQTEIETGARVRETQSMADLMQLIEVEKPEVIAKSINERQLSFLIDTGAVHDKQQKKLEAEVKKIKAVLLEHARNNKWRSLAGENGSATIKPSTSTKITPSDLLRKLVSLGKKNLFDVCFKPRLAEAKEYLGKAELADISEVTVEEYGTVSLKVTR
jgi:hypothetical protein